MYGWHLDKLRLISYQCNSMWKMQNQKRERERQRRREREGENGYWIYFWFYFCTKFDVPIRCVIVADAVSVGFSVFFIDVSFKAEDNADKKFTNSPSCQYKFIETIITKRKMYTHTLCSARYLSSCVCVRASTKPVVVPKINNWSNFLNIVTVTLILRK